jgi:hypothetical protein
LHVWGQNLCAALEAGERLQNSGDFVWLDQLHCADHDGLACWFPNLRDTCAAVRSDLPLLTEPPLEIMPWSTQCITSGTRSRSGAQL